jgi:hypothetical protein
MEQRFLTQEERPEQELATLVPQESLPATQQKSAALVGNQLDPEVVDGLMRRLDQVSAAEKALEARPKSRFCRKPPEFARSFLPQNRAEPPLRTS